VNDDLTTTAPSTALLVAAGLTVFAILVAVTYESEGLGDEKRC
jgi:hypothetical protein